MFQSVLQSLVRIILCSFLTGQIDVSLAVGDTLAQPFILLGNRDIIQHITLDGEEGLTVLNDTEYDIIGIDFDARDGFMFWTDVAKKTINRAYLDGSDMTVLVDSSLRDPDGLAWDWATKKVYWTDSGRRRVEVYDPERDVRKQLINTGPNTLPRDIVVDPSTGWLFWSDWGDTPKIERMSMDGTNHSTIISSDIVWPTGLAIDYATLTLFWSDTNLDRLESSNFDGTNRTVLLEGLFIFYPFAIAFYNGSLFWGDWVVGFVFRLTVADPDDHNIVWAVLEMEPTGMKIVSQSGQSEVSSPCRVANGNCSHLCLISATSPKGYRCVCPRHLHLASNHRDCRGSTTTDTSTAVTTEYIPPSQGSCREANHTKCCVEGDCQGLPPVCLCSAECHSLGTCCGDIDSVCPASPHSEVTEYLLVANREGIVRLELDGQRQEPLVRGEENTIAVDFDIRSNYMYWTDVTQGKIRRSFLNGSDVMTLLDDEIETPDGIAVDWINQKLYWTDARLKRIEVFDLMRGFRKQLISTGAETIPRTIVVDPGTRWLYWSDWGERALIERASMDGQARQTVASSSLVWPNGLTLDTELQSLYWADAMLDKIESANVDGSNRHVLTTLGIFHPFSLTVLNSQLYWSDWDMDAILTGGSGLYLNARHLAHINGSRPMGIQAVSTRKQPLMPNPCFLNATCSHICLLSAVSVGGYNCTCPDSLEMSSSLNHCVSIQDTENMKNSDNAEDEFPPKTATVSQSPVLPSVTPTSVVHSSSGAAFRLDVLPVSLAAVIVVLSATVIAMFIFLIVRLCTKKQKGIFLLKRRLPVIPNEYVTVLSNLNPEVTSDSTT